MEKRTKRKNFLSSFLAILVMAVMLTGSMLTGKNLGIVQRSLDRVVEAMRKDGDNAFFRFDMSPQDGSLGYGAGYHPSMRQAEKMANELTCYLESITGWKQ